MSKIIGDYILFDDGTYKEIKKDSSDHKYYEVNNKYSSNKRFDFELIRALNYIEEGDGDDICFNGTQITVRKYLDVQYGDAIQNKLLKELEGKELKYTLLYNDGFMGANRELVLRYEGLMLFNTEDQAKEYIKVLAKKLAAMNRVYMEDIGANDRPIFISTLDQKSFEYHVFVDVVKYDMLEETIARKIKVMKYKEIRR